MIGSIKKIGRATGFSFVAVVIGSFAWMNSGSAEDVTTDNIKIEKVWARATAPGAQAGAAYMSLSALGATGDRLIAAESPIADQVNLHTTQMDSGIMRMVLLPGIEVAAGEATVLKPGGLHIMLLGLDQQLTEGQSVPLTLVFEQAGPIDVLIDVESIVAAGPSVHDHGAAQASHDHGQAAISQSADAGHQHSADVAQATHSDGHSDGHVDKDEKTAEAAHAHGDAGAQAAQHGHDQTNMTATADVDADHHFDLEILARALHGDLETSGGVPVIRIAQGDRAVLDWVSDEGTQLHLHGYDLDVNLEAGASSRMTVEAIFAGRFALEAHGFAGAPVASHDHGETSPGAVAGSTTTDHHAADDDPRPTGDEVVLLYLEVIPN